MLHHAIDRIAGTDPDRPAVIHDGRTFTFGELSARVRAAAAGVAARTAPGARVAMVGENNPAWVEAYYGVPRAGRVLVFLNHRLAPAELASVLRRSGASLLVGTPEELDRLAPAVAEIDGLDTLDLAGWEDLVGAAGPGAPEGSAAEPDGAGAGAAGDGAAGDGAVGNRAPAWIIYTSGTTGSPKGATLSHDNFAASIEASAVGRPVLPDDVYLYPFPLCHVSGYNVLRVLAAGRPVVLADRFTPEVFVDLVDRHGVTTTSVAATMLSSLLDHLADHPEDRARLGSLRSVAYGAAPMPPALLRRAHDALGVAFTGGYGMTELAGNAVFLGPDEHRRGLAGEDRLLATAGRAAPNVEIRVVDDDARTLPAGQPGEIVARGRQVMLGYWDDEATTGRSFTGDWFHTGDIGVFDNEGVLAIVDRKKDVIVTGAENVSSLEVEEEILRSCPEVREVAVVGVPDPHWGENVCAVVVYRPGSALAAADLIGRVRRSLAGYKAPRHVVATDELPKNGTGKVVKDDLRRWLADRPDLLGARR
ncbi:MAG TPA: AMP-binding protein [Acidimicrobiales bacterium]|nr:AMP-binding protein [Acidimicrobiales bacterium]